MHRQTTAYHPESNGAVKRLHRRLKDALHSRTAAATWADELPWVLLGLHAQPREDTGLFSSEAVFGTPIVLPNEFLSNDEMSVDSVLKNMSKTLDAPPYSLPRYNSSHQLPSELPANLVSARLVWVRRDFVIPPLQPLYARPYPVIRRAPRSFTIRVGARDEIVAISRLKVCMAMDAMPGSPPRHGRPPGPGAAITPAAARRPPSRSSCCQTGLVCTPLDHSTFPADGAAEHPPGNRFYPTPRGGFCAPRAGGSSAASTTLVSAAPTETANKDRPLTSSALLTRPVLGGEPCGGCSTPLLQTDQPAVQYTVLQHTCTVPVYKPTMYAE
jgi:hypothetical protein